MNHDILVLGASAGGVDALTRLCHGFPSDLPAAVLIVQHISPTARSVLPMLLDRAGPLRVTHAVDDEAPVAGRAYVAPPDLHLLVNTASGRLMLRRGPQENRTRPAIDPLFRSAAAAFGGRVIGVVLSGLLDDGTAGLRAIKACGGISVVQKPEDAAWPDMPRNALRGDTPDYVVPIAEMGPLLSRLTRSAAGASLPVPPQLAAEVALSAQEALVTPQNIGQPSRISCPQCGGVLNEIREPRTLRFRCQIGHAFSPESLAATQRDSLDETLAAAIRTHHDRQYLFRRMERLSRERGLPHAADRWASAAEKAERSAEVITEAVKALRDATHESGQPPKREDGA